jgi:hypothetical protein
VQRLGELMELGFTEFVFFSFDRDDPSVLELLATDVIPQLRRQSEVTPRRRAHS